MLASHSHEQAIVRQWTPEPRALLELWRHEGARTDRAFGFFEEPDLEWRPAAMERSIRQLLVHIANARYATVYWLLAPSDALPRSHATECDLQWGNVQPRKVLADAGAKLFHTLASLPTERFADLVAPFGALETRGVMALGMFKHELHHRGELHAYARVLGKRPVSLYAPIES